MDQKIIFIDWYGTLSDSKFWDHLDNSNFELIRNCLFGNLNHLLVPWMRGKLATEEVIAQISENSNLDQEYLLNEFVVSCKNMTVSESKLRLIKELRQSGFRIYVATDNMDSFSRWTAPSLCLDTHFDGILNSSNIGALKGDFDNEGGSLFFQRFIAENSLHPNNCLLIDDNEDKSGLIRKYGINYHKIDNSSDLENVLATACSKQTDSKAKSYNQPFLSR